jgi:hypothetical protein
MTDYPYQGRYTERLLAEGRAIGRAVAEMKAKAIAQAQAEVIAEAEGEMRGHAMSVLKVLEGRGVSMSQEVRERVMGCQDLDLLDAWLLRAIRVESAEELFG